MRYRYAAWAIQALIFFLTMNDPFFGDAISTVSRAALHIYNEQLGTIWYLPQQDPGHPTLIPYLLALLWTIFGKHLWVGHLLTLVFAWGVTAQLHKMALRAVDGIKAHGVLLLVLVHPGFLAQSAMVLTHLPLTFFFLWALNSLLYQPRFKSFWVASMLMMLTHLEGAFLLSGTAAVFFLSQIKQQPMKKAVVHSALFFAPAFVTLFIWGWAHAQHSGWWFSSPVYASHRSWMGLSSMLKSFALIAWRMVDYGNLVFYLVVLWAAVKWKLYRHPLFGYVCGAFFMCSLVFAVLMSKSIAHRYFLPIHLPAFVLLLLACNELRKKQGDLILLVSVICMAAGNFMYYPGKCIGDATLAYRNYFFLVNDIKEDLPPDMVMYTYPPLSNHDSVVTLNETTLIHTQPLYGKQVQQVPVVLQSNCNCEFTGEEQKVLKTWKGKSYEREAVYVNILFNPLVYPTPPLDEPLREQSTFERWMEEKKSGLR